MATVVSQPTTTTHKEAANSVSMSTGQRGTICEGDADDLITGVGVSQMICEDSTADTDEHGSGMNPVGGINDGMMDAGEGGRSIHGGGMGRSEGGSDAVIADICRPVSEGTSAGTEALECQRDISPAGDAQGGAEGGVDDVMTDDEEEQRLVTMDSSSIIPEAAMKCGILPIDSAEEDSLVLMSGEGVLQSQSDRSPDQQQQQQPQQLCVGCKRPITERYLLKVMDQFWHEDCLKCSCCDCRLGEVGSTLFTKANLLLCRRDYLRLFGATGCCSVCSKMIPAFEMVMKAKGNVYHLECFACQQCNHRFCIGDRYYLYDNKILCEFDYEERIVFARLSHGYNALSTIKRQTQSINSLPANNCRTSNLNGC